MKRLRDISVRYCKGIGPTRAKALHGIGVDTVEDLFYYFPHRYEDRTNFNPIAKLKEGEFHTIKGEVFARGERRSFRRRRFTIQEVVVTDTSGRISCVWFNQPYLKEYFKVGAVFILYGKVERYGAKLQMNSPEFEAVDEEEESLSVGRIIPVYRVTEGISQRIFRRIVFSVIEAYCPLLKDALTFDIRARNNLLNLAKALRNIHFPDNLQMQKEAYRRLSFEEFFLFQLPLVLRKLKKKERKGITHKTQGLMVPEFKKSLPFTLTVSQERVLEEVSVDMAKEQPMQRLLQGDVGSGKTIVATIASLISIQGRYQVGFMVPTEILAKQHYEKIMFQTEGMRIGNRKIKIALMTGSVPKKEKERISQEIKSGKIDMVIGTHALLDEGIHFKNLGLVVIDEQHKFGVAQRALLPQKGPSPDVLVMTA
ncbi:MAG: DEAD/DEAH box helicase, partial [Candidatus Omnitrophica bacterium]|nr:DEAD/DEAH box helicase [Candidatus Omnitrophota bacterium]